MVHNNELSILRNRITRLENLGSTIDNPSGDLFVKVPKANPFGVGANIRYLQELISQLSYRVAVVEGQLNDALSILSLDSHNLVGGGVPLQEIHGSMFLVKAATPLVHGSPLAFTTGANKLLFVVHSGTVDTGTIHIDGNVIDPNTGTIAASVEDIVVDAISTDSSTTDADGNPIYDFTGAYISTNMWIGNVIISSTTMDTNVDVYAFSADRWRNSSDTYIQEFSVRVHPSSTSAWGYFYLYKVTTNGMKRDMNLIASVSMPVSASESNESYTYRRVLDPEVHLADADEGIILLAYLGPAGSSYFRDIQTKVLGRGRSSQAVTIEPSVPPSGPAGGTPASSKRGGGIYIGTPGGE